MPSISNRYIKKLEQRAQRARDKNLPPFELETFLFKEQIEFVSAEARYATACCSVRAGKTVACAADLIATAIKNPGTTGLYITLARSSAKRICWPELLKINRNYGLRAVPNMAELTLTFPNGSIIYLLGANVESEIEKVRGLSNVILVYLDESQAFRSHIKELVEDIVVKRLYDTNGRCRMIGTPGPLLAGYYYECCHSDTWAHFNWTMHNNPYLKIKSGMHPDQLIAQDCKMKGVDLTDPSIQRECFGRWVLDANALLLNYNAAINDYDELPIGNYTYLLGMDLGVKDSDSLSLIAFSDTSEVTYLVEEDVISDQLTDELAKKIIDLRAKYPIAGIVCDAGGLGLKVVNDLNARYGLQITAAEKKDKMSNYRILNNALRTGRFKAKKTSCFAQDCNLLEKDRDKSTPDKIVVKGHSDAVDSTLYVFKLSPAYAYIPPKPLPQIGTEEHSQHVAQQLFEHHVSKLERERKNKEGDMFGTWNVDQNMEPLWNKWSD